MSTFLRVSYMILVNGIPPTMETRLGSGLLAILPRTMAHERTPGREQFQHLLRPCEPSL
jgi:hypothetical protein